ncbi:MAG: hypothetical protein LBB16_00875 [Puniceicoccales bacterium]|jgi:hypothetical protein|nr:hypothetical protein [Puniceicoccales bacterium]
MSNSAESVVKISSENSENSEGADEEGGDKGINILKVSRGYGAPFFRSEERIFDDMVFFVNAFIVAALKISVYPVRDEWDNAGEERERIMSSESSALFARTNFVSRDETNSNTRLQSDSVPSVAMTLGG